MRWTNWSSSMSRVVVYQDEGSEPTHKGNPLFLDYHSLLILRVQRHEDHEEDEVHEEGAVHEGHEEDEGHEEGSRQGYEACVKERVFCLPGSLHGRQIVFVAAFAC